MLPGVYIMREKKTEWQENKGKVTRPVREKNTRKFQTLNSFGKLNKEGLDSPYKQRQH